MHHVLGVRADAAANAENRLDKQRRLDQATIEEVRGGVEMPDVVTLDFEPGVVVAARLQDMGDVFERILENALIGPGEIGFFPIVFPLLDARNHFVQTEVHGAHVERSHFRLELQRWLQAVLDGHSWRAASGDVDDHIGCRLDPRQEPHEHFWVLRRATVPGLARMQVHHCRAGFGGADSRIGDFIRRDRQMW